MANSFPIILPSNTKGYATNATNKFRVRFSQPITLNGNWLCGLHSITFPHSWPSLGTEEDQFIEIFTKDDLFLRIFVPQGNFNNGEELENFLNTAVKVELEDYLSTRSLPRKKREAEESEGARLYREALDAVKNANKANEENIKKMQAEEEEERKKMKAKEEEERAEKERQERLWKVDAARNYNQSLRAIGQKEDEKSKKIIEDYEREENERLEKERKQNQELENLKRAEAERVERENKEKAEKENLKRLENERVEREKKEKIEKENLKRLADEKELEKKNKDKIEKAQKLEEENNEKERIKKLDEEKELENKKKLEKEKEDVVEKASKLAEEKELENKKKEELEKKRKDEIEKLERDKEKEKIKKLDEEKELEAVRELSAAQKIEFERKRKLQKYDEGYLNKPNRSKRSKLEVYMLPHNMHNEQVLNIFNSIKFILNKSIKKFTVNFNEDVITHIKFSPQLNYSLGFSENTTLKNNEKAPYSYDISGGITQICVYANGITENIIFGDSLSSLLRIVTVTEKQGEMVEKIYDSPLFSKVLPKQISEIEIELRTLSGRLIPFEYGVTIVTLLFKKAVYF